MPFGNLIKNFGASGGQNPSGGFGQAFFDRLGGSLIDKIGGEFDRAIGIPSPGDLTRKYMKDAFPGTNPWEQIGSPGAVSGTQQANVRRQTNTAKDIAKIQAKAQVRSAEIAASPMHRKISVVDLPKLQHEIDNLEADTKNKLAQAALATANRKWQEARNRMADVFVEFDLEKVKHGQLGQAIRALSTYGLHDEGVPGVDTSWQETAVTWAIAVLSVVAGGKFLKALKRKPKTEINIPPQNIQLNPGYDIGTRHIQPQLPLGH